MKLILNRISFGICLLFCLSSNAQVVLNEIYSEPGAGKEEFFELYNINTSNTPSSLDAYSIISYFEEGNKKGFYVLDIPNLSVASKGYFVGASSIPFDYQGTTNSTAANFSWNDPNLALNYGYLRKWVSNGNTAADGNKNYDLEALPSNFNDFFSRRSGSGATYNAFVYKNGKLVNSFFGGTGGNVTMPSFISSMPTFKLEVVTEAETKTHVLNFGSLKNKPIESIEYVTQDIGSDNGYIKTRDGYCGTWTKSSATAYHTPGGTNTSSTEELDSDLTMDVHLYNGATPSDPSFVVYNVTAGSSASFPVELQVYLDNGTIDGQLDSGDEFVEIQTENSVTDGPFTTNVTRGENVLIVVKTDAGCIDQIAYAEPLAENISLPIQLLSIQADVNKNELNMQWSVTGNEWGNYFEIQKSEDGRNFSTIGTAFATGKPGNESYTFKGLTDGAAYYRLKLVNKNKGIEYSKIISLKARENYSSGIRLMQNPVVSSLSFTYQSISDDQCTVSIYTITGTRLFTKNTSMRKGLNSLAFDVSNSLKNGMYILEIVTNNQRSTSKFIKQ